MLKKIYKSFFKKNVEDEVRPLPHEIFEKELIRLGVNPYSKNNDFIDESDGFPRLSRHVAERAYILFIFHLIATSQIDFNDAINFFMKYSIYFKLTKKEISYLEIPESFPKNESTWKIEEILIYLWALNLIDTLSFPDKICDENKVISVFYEDGYLINPNRFITEKNDLKGLREIQVMFNLYHVLNKHMVALENNDKLSFNINYNVLSNRYNGFLWLLNKNELKKDIEEVPFSKQRIQVKGSI